MAAIVTNTEKRIDSLRKGEQIKCPKCKNGFFSAVGNPETTKLFMCSHCLAKIILTVNANVSD